MDRGQLSGALHALRLWLPRSRPLGVPAEETLMPHLLFIKRVSLWWLVVSLFLLGTAASHAGATNNPALPSVTWRADDRVLILAPHPDDEVLACGGLIQQAVAHKLPVRVIFFTYGDNNQWSFTLYRKHPVLLPSAMRQMGEVRHNEATAATTALGLNKEQLTFLGYPDFGTSKIWSRGWGTNTLFHSMLTHVTAVPYPDAFRPGAPYKGEEILADLTQLIRAFKPTKVFVSHPADQNGDHRALYLFTRVALWNLEHEIQPELLPYLVHFNRWPTKSGWHPDSALHPPESLADQLPWRAITLSLVECAAKRNALLKHASQTGYASRYLFSFVRANELFGDFPVIHPKNEDTAKYEAALRTRTGPTTEPADELTDEERALFVGVVWRYIYRDQDALVFAVELSRPLAKTVQASFSAFGWRHDAAFAAMPKIRVELGEFHYNVFDQTRQLPSETVTLERHAREIMVHIPLKLLGDPERVLATARTYLADLPLDAEAWRVLDLRATAPTPM
ncbi:MAG: PIG-L family deacetylase [Verrucomicrobia bacterium]|nr:MAG: PIG-L family deacetylase [Verrucomicrobiota bacterium]